MSYYRRIQFLLDIKHGFGLRCMEIGGKEDSRSFYEDGTLCTYAEDQYHSAICTLLRYEDPGFIRTGKTQEAERNRLLKEGICEFHPCPKGEIAVEITTGKDKIFLKIQEEKYRGYDVVCSCKSRYCIHTVIAARFCRKRLNDLRHRYLFSELPVDKGLFMDPVLTESIEDGIIEDLSEESVGKIHTLISMLDGPNSREYYRLFHQYLLGLEPAYYDYDAHFFEQFEFFLLALFENRGYQKAVIAEGSYADPENYEGRQRRSNRAVFKRVFREYGKVIKELDRKSDYQENPYKEFLLKYRGDLRGLLQYYAVGLEQKLKDCDLPYLDKIAEIPDAGREYFALAAEKMDVLGDNPKTVPIFRKLLSRLPQEEQIDIYSRLVRISMPLVEIQKLDRDAQKKLIYNMPLTAESFRYIWEDLLAERENAEKGRYLLAVLDKVLAAKNRQLTEAVVQTAAGLPDSRLLYAFVLRVLDPSSKRGRESIPASSPENELSVYFDCQYRFENRGSSFSTFFSVAVPNDPEDALFRVEEKEGDLHFAVNRFRDLNYPAKTVRAVCLSGKEEEYQRGIEENTDAVETYLFSQNNRKFAREYKALCESFQTEKVLFTESEKASIDWLIYRTEGSNGLAFRIGNTKKYIVKDAGEFIAAFRNGQTVEYGKDLIFSHDPDNLQDSDAAMIRLLMAARITRGRAGDSKNRRYITINDSLMGSLLELLAGRTVMYNERPCLVRLEKQKIMLHISKKYVLSMQLKRGQELLPLVGKGYLVSPHEGGLVLDRVDATSEEVSLLELVQQNPAVGVKPILKDFRKNIYSRFFEMFDVDKAVSGDFRLSEIRLNSYFDYENGVITVETGILKDDRAIREDQLTERQDRNKFELLQNYLASIGFVGDRMEDESRVLSFFKMDFTRLKMLTNVYLSESLRKKEILSVGRQTVRVTYRNNLIHVFLEKSDFSEAELNQIIRGLRKKKKYILLGEDRIVDLDSEAARDFCDAVEDFGMDPKDLYREKTVSMVTAIKAFAHEKSCRVDKYLRDMIEEIRTFKDAEIKVPALSGTLRNYQREGYNWLTILSRYGMGGILADDMGLGKTVQIIALIKADKEKKPSLVVCPKSLVFNWISEFARFDGETAVKQIYGTEAQRSEIIQAIDYHKKAVYVTSYDSLRNDIGKYTGEFNYGVLDEAQFIKNVHALKTKSVKELQARHRFALTGTPIENSVADLWSIFDFILPGYFEELAAFKSSDTADIAKKAAPFILRRVKEDVLDDLPAKYERILSADMSAGQRKLYDALRMDARNRLDGGGKAFDLLPYLTRLRQVCVDPGMFVADYRDGSGKIDTLRTLIPEYLQTGHRILIFSQFVKALESVSSCLQEMDIPAYFLTGATPAKERVDMMEAFNSGSGTDVFLISLKAGGTGLNLTGADTVIHLDPWWNVAAENQASDRTHRIGQTRNVEVIKLIAENSIEQRVVELQDLKKDVISQVISDDDGSVTSASLEDIAFILR